MDCLGIQLNIYPSIVSIHKHQYKTRTLGPFQWGFCVQKRRPISYLKPSKYRFHCTSQLNSAEIAPVASAAYGVLLLGGGLFAYTRTQSKGSLFGGLTGAGLMGLAYFLMQAPGTKDSGEALAFGSALLFASVFGIRLGATRKLVPAGPLLALSLCALALFLSAYLQETV